jgi:hypothetical protein
VGRPWHFGVLHENYGPLIQKRYVRRRTVLPSNTRIVPMWTVNYASIFFGRRSMSAVSDTFTRYATAEKELCESVGATLAQAIQEIEDKYGIRIAELRVTMDREGPLGSSRANCVLVREVLGKSAKGGCRYLESGEGNTHP